MPKLNINQSINFLESRKEYVKEIDEALYLYDLLISIDNRTKSFYAAKFITDLANNILKIELKYTEAKYG